MSSKFKVRPDAKGRITLGKIAEGVSSYTVTHQADRIILEPNVEILASEKWFHNNKVAQEKLKKGIEDSANGRVKTRESYAKFADDDIE